MTKAEVVTGINSILLEMDFPAIEEHHYQANLLQFLAMDSIDWVEFIMKVEKRFSVEISDEAAVEKQTFIALVEHVADLKSIPV